MIPAENVTVVLSEKGWVKAAKGHDIDSSALNYKSGDSFLKDAKGRSNKMAIFLDSTGRSYTLLANSLPSARGQGEPLTGRLTPPIGAEFIDVVMGDDDQPIILCVVGFLAYYTNEPIIMGSFGASIFVLFVLPDSPFAQPRNVIFGHFVTTLIGLIFFHFVGSDWWSMAFALALAIAAMQILRVPHPPAGSNPFKTLKGNQRLI